MDAELVAFQHLQHQTQCNRGGKWITPGHVPTRPGQMQTTHFLYFPPCLLLLSQSHAAFRSTGTEFGLKKGFKAVLGIFHMKGKGCFSHPQEANRKIGCQFKGREGPPRKPRA